MNSHRAGDRASPAGDHRVGSALRAAALVGLSGALLVLRLESRPFHTDAGAAFPENASADDRGPQPSLWSGAPTEFLFLDDASAEPAHGGSPAPSLVPVSRLSDLPGPGRRGAPVGARIRSFPPAFARARTTARAPVDLSRLDGLALPIADAPLRHGATCRSRPSSSLPVRASDVVPALASRGGAAMAWTPLPPGLAPVEVNLFYAWRGRFAQVSLEWDYAEPPLYRVVANTYASARFDDAGPLASSDGWRPLAAARTELASLHARLVGEGAEFLTRTGAYASKLHPPATTPAETLARIPKIEVHGNMIVSLAGAGMSCARYGEGEGAALECSCETPR